MGGALFWEKSLAKADYELRQKGETTLSPVPLVASNQAADYELRQKGAEQGHFARKQVFGKSSQTTLSPVPLIASNQADFSPASHFNSKLLRFSFTLAEILIVLGIIGLIADMTIPTLIQKTQEKIAVSRLLKAYSTFENAFRLAAAENGPIEDWNGVGDDTPEGAMSFLNMIAPYLNLVQICEVDTENSACFGKKRYKYLDGSNAAIPDKASNAAKALLADGISFYIISKSKNCNGNHGSGSLSRTCASFFVDINGQNNPNQWGVDAFVFHLTKDGLIPRGTQNETVYSFENSCSAKAPTGYTNGTGCTAWVIYNGNMDYLHCSDLSWSGKKKCKD